MSGRRGYPSGILPGLVAVTLLGSPGGSLPGQLVAELELQPSHLAARCQGVPVRSGVWTEIRRALGHPDHTMAEAALLPVQDSLERHVHAHPGDTEARYALAALLGARSVVAQGRARLEWADAMRAEAARVLAGAPGHPGAQHLLGRLHAGVMRMSRFKRFLARTLFGADALDDASWEGARRHLEAAEAGEPCVPEHHLELALVYHDLGMVVEALLEAQHVLQLGASRPGSAELVRKAARLVEAASPSAADRGPDGA